MSRADKLRLLQLLQERERRYKQQRHARIYGTLYPWQLEFVAATAKYSQCCLIAANRIGKTYLGTYIDATHALGDYPTDWCGHKFTHPPTIWALGYSAEKTRDLLQYELVGRKNGDKFDGGLINADRIVGYESMTGTPNALRTILVQHSSGGVSRIQFWSYSQGQHALMGDAVDWFHIDEEPRDAAIWPQVLVRTATGDQGRGGRGILTFTPENGRTDLVLQFLDNPSNCQFCTTKGWDDAPHLSDKTKQELLASFPPHQRDMRTKGIPMLGHGRIYDIGEDEITCEPFAIPPHWWVINGMDFGYDHPQSQVKLVWDRDSDTYYVTNVWRKSLMMPIQAWGAVKHWAQGVPTAWPLDGLQTEKGSGKQQMSYYADAGFNLLNDHATWPDGTNGVEAGLFEIRDLMMQGRFKVFAGLRDFFDEFLQYHRDDKGNIVKSHDDVLDAVRYAYMMRRYAVRVGDVATGKMQPIKYKTYGRLYAR